MSRVIIFDFDDTLVETTGVFNIARADFCRRMHDLGISIPGLEHLVDELDVKNVKEAGYFAAHCFPTALREAYEHCCRVNRIQVQDHIRSEVEGLGWSVFHQKPSTIDHAHNVLEHLQKHYPLVLLTKGEQDFQKRRIEESGLKGYFSETIIVGDKNRELFQGLIQSLKVIPADSWSVGNSVKSDINPALQAGFKAIHFAGTTWHYEYAEPIGSHHKADSLLEVKEIILGKSGQASQADEAEEIIGRAEE
ncbi:MAG: HAD family hydrolase [Firmicutes bacterium]|nr:HAD family hydrolase [Bacillota bacterium]